MESLRSSRSLVIGGTGMLAAATYWLAARSATTLVVARHASRFATGNHRIVPLDLNWNSPTFADELCRELAASDPIANALLWLHDPAPILRWLIPLLGDALVVVVLGSLGGRPDVPQTATHLATVQLGSKPSGGRRRWLTDQEISDGAIAALSDGRSRIVGDLLPV